MSWESSIEYYRIINEAVRERLGGLLGTKFTMEKDFYKKRLEERFGIETLIPEENEREDVHRIIFGELCAGVIEPASKERLKKIIEGLAARGAQGVVLGCTEILLIISQNDTPIPIFDTTRIHAMAAVKRAMG